MKLVTTGTPSALASAATLSSSPNRRTSTSAMMTGARARDRRSSTSSAQAATASGSTGVGSAGTTGAQSTPGMSRGISM